MTRVATAGLEALVFAPTPARLGTVGVEALVFTPAPARLGTAGVEVLAFTVQPGRVAAAGVEALVFIPATLDATVAVTHEHTVTSSAPLVVVDGSSAITHTAAFALGGVSVATGTLTPAPVPTDELGEGSVVTPPPSFRPMPQRLPAARLMTEYPELEALRPLLEVKHLTKQRLLDAYRQWVDALKSYADLALVTDQLDLLVNNKTWPLLRREELRRELAPRYGDALADRLSRALHRWSEQQSFDEEANWRTIEEWTAGIRPTTEF